MTGGLLKDRKYIYTAERSGMIHEAGFTNSLSLSMRSRPGDVTLNSVKAYIIAFIPVLLIRYWQDMFIGIPGW